MRRWGYTAAAAVLAAGTVLLGGCGSAGTPLGMQKTKDGLVLLVGYQCSDTSTSLVKLRVANAGSAGAAPLWQFEGKEPDSVHPVHSVNLGDVPTGYHETVNTLSSQPVGAEVSVTAWVVGHRYHATFDVKQLDADTIVTADGKRKSAREFGREFGCGTQLA